MSSRNASLVECLMCVVTAIVTDSGTVLASSAAPSSQPAPVETRFLDAVEGKAQGVSGYSVVEVQPNHWIAHLLGPKGGEVANVEYDTRKAGLLECHYSGPEGVFTLYWQHAAGWVQVDVADGRTARFTFNTKALQWVPSEGGDAILAEFSVALRRIGAGEKDLLPAAPPPTHVIPRESQPEVAVYDSRRPLYPCDESPSNMSRCGVYATVKSTACQYSLYCTNEQCNNGHCWGCCSTSPCNCYCQLGDFFCYCFTYGFWCLS